MGEIIETGTILKEKVKYKENWPHHSHPIMFDFPAQMGRSINWVTTIGSCVGPSLD